MFYILLNVRRLHAEGFSHYCFKAHESSKSLSLIKMHTTQGHLHIVSPRNLPSVDWAACTVVLKVPELHEITIGFLPLVPQNSIFHLLDPSSCRPTFHFKHMRVGGAPILHVYQCVCGNCATNVLVRLI